MNTLPIRRHAPTAPCLAFLAGMAVTAVCAALAAVPRPALPVEAPLRPAAPAPHHAPAPAAGYLVTINDGGLTAG